MKTLVVGDSRKRIAEPWEGKEIACKQCGFKGILQHGDKVDVVHYKTRFNNPRRSGVFMKCPTCGGQMCAWVSYGEG